MLDTVNLMLLGTGYFWDLFFFYVIILDLVLGYKLLSLTLSVLTF